MCRVPRNPNLRILHDESDVIFPLRDRTADGHLFTVPENVVASCEEFVTECWVKMLADWPGSFLPADAKPAVLNVALFKLHRIANRNPGCNHKSDEEVRHLHI